MALWKTDDSGSEYRAIVSVAADERVTQVRLGRRGVAVAGTDRGRLYHWIFEDDVPELTDVSSVADDEITALEFLVGGSSVVAGTSRGEVSSWFRAPVPRGGEAMVRAHLFEPQGSPVRAFAVSPRDRSFAASSDDGALVLRHQTSERTLARIDGAKAVPLLVVAPKADAVYGLADGTLAPFALLNPHPEVSVRTLFARVWYEGYGSPEYVWQSTGATDDFESKFSLVPLIFGTIKGTLYAMLFAVPLAVLGALYTSQFVHPTIKAKVKPTIEIMAALPSVVIGFLAGLYLAGVVERHLVAVFVVMVLLPVFGTAGVFAWRLLPRSLAGSLRPGTEIVAILPLLLLATVVGVAIGPAIEAWLFGGDARSWLGTALGLTYDQRNCLVVGLAMGFAVIPVIFTISEDAFTSVPASLTAASLALGASRWQTACTRRPSHGQPRRLFGDDGGLRPRGRRDDDRADGHRQYAHHGVVDLQRHPDAVCQHRRRDRRGALRRLTLPHAVPVSRRPLRHDVSHQHRRRGHPAAAARTVQGGVMSTLRAMLRRGDPAIWLAGTGLGISILMIAGMILLILVNGLGFFWPRPLALVTLKDQTVLLGEIMRREAIPAPGTDDDLKRFLIQLKLGQPRPHGRRLQVGERGRHRAHGYPADAVYLERREVRPVSRRAALLTDGDRQIASGSEAVQAGWMPLVSRASADSSGGFAGWSATKSGG